MTISLSLDGVHLRAGRLRHTWHVGPNQVRPARPWDRLTQFGVLIFWPQAFPWLSFDAEAAPAAGGPGVKFLSTPAAIDAACAAHNVPRDTLAPPRFLEQNRYLVASLPQQNRFTLSIELDTDDADFRAAAATRRDPATGALVQPVQIIYFDAKQFGTLVSQPGRFDITFKPCTPLPKFTGSVVVDLGNTVTTAASLSETGIAYRTDSVDLIPLDANTKPDEAPLLQSVLRIESITTTVLPDETAPTGARRFPQPGLSGDESPTAVKFQAGRNATAGSVEDLPEGVVFGAKQLLSVKDTAADKDRFVMLNVPHARPGGGPAQPETVEVLNRLPGELLFTHAVRRFRETAKAWPADLVLTYPTTYTRAELNQLARAAVRGWLRATGQPQSAGSPHEPDEDAGLENVAIGARQWLSMPTDPAGDVTDSGLIGLAMDEATAAAFFFVYKRVFESPGGLNRFRYLHPDGTRVLVFDCGGGTTDVALVRAISREAQTLDVEVIARTGLRGFGGDHITREACRLVKAKLALLVARTASPAAVPAGVQAPPAAAPAGDAAAKKLVNDFLEKVAKIDPQDQFVPTKFDPTKVDSESFRRRAAFNALWKFGDAVKQKLGDGKPVKLKDLPPALLQPDVSPLFAAVVQRFAAAPRAQLLAQIGDIAINPWELDALVRDKISGAMHKCNNLIRDKLIAPAGGREPEVDWVVLSGNGARYPLIQKAAREQLNVAYLDERLTFERENLKHAVGKGAIMARMVTRVPQDASIRFPRHLSKVLPYDVGHRSLVDNTTKTLFREFTAYDDLRNQTRPVEVRPTGEAAATFVLERRFPGDDGWAQYAAYRFAGGTRGRLTVGYDPEADQFTVTDAATGEMGECKDLTDPREHQSPATRGDF